MKSTTGTDRPQVRVRRPFEARTLPIDPSSLTGDERYRLEHQVLAKVKGTPRFLLRELFEFFRGRADCFPTNAGIEDASGISRRNVAYLLRVLESAEIV